MWTSQVYGHHDKMARTKTESVREEDLVCPRSKVQVPSLLVLYVLNYGKLYLPTSQILTSFSHLRLPSRAILSKV